MDKIAHDENWVQKKKYYPGFQWLGYPNPGFGHHSRGLAGGVGAVSTREYDDNHRTQA